MLHEKVAICVAWMPLGYDAGMSSNSMLVARRIIGEHDVYDGNMKKVCTPQDHFAIMPFSKQQVEQSCASSAYVEVACRGRCKSYSDLLQWHVVMTLLGAPQQ